MRNRRYGVSCIYVRFSRFALSIQKPHEAVGVG